MSPMSNNPVTNWAESMREVQEEIGKTMDHYEEYYQGDNINKAWLHFANEHAKNERSKQFHNDLEKTQTKRSVNFFDDFSMTQTGKPDLKTRVEELEKRLDRIEGAKSSFIHIPTPSEVKKFS